MYHLYILSLYLWFSKNNFNFVKDYSALLLLVITLAFERKAASYWQFLGSLIPPISCIPKQRLKFKISIKHHDSTSVWISALKSLVPPVTILVVGVWGYFYRAFTTWILSRSRFISWYSLCAFTTCDWKFWRRVT